MRGGALLDLQRVKEFQVYTYYGDDMASTWITKPGEHAVGYSDHLNSNCITIVANDDNYALAA